MSVKKNTAALKVTLPTESTAYAYWSLMGISKGRVTSRAIDHLLRKCFPIFKEAGILEDFFSCEAIEMIENGYTPQETLASLEALEKGIETPQKKKKKKNAESVTTGYENKPKDERRESVVAEKVIPVKEPPENIVSEFNINGEKAAKEDKLKSFLKTNKNKKEKDLYE